MNYLLLAAAAAAQAFNLNCTGTLSYSSPIAFEPFSVAYRVDLSHKKWCEGECRRTFDFVEISPSRLTFTKEREQTLWGPIITITSVDRVTGEYRSFRGYGSRSSDNRARAWEGKCERAPFTGLPRVTTKF